MAARDTAEASLRARCAELAHQVMDVARADGATAFLPSPDSRLLACAHGVPRNRSSARYVAGLVGSTVESVPMLRLLCEGHAAVLRRNDAIPLLPGQQSVLALLGIETLSLVPSNLWSGWRFGVTFSHGHPLEIELETLVTVQKLLDQEAAEMHGLVVQLTRNRTAQRTRRMPPKDM